MKWNRDKPLMVLTIITDTYECGRFGSYKEPLKLRKRFNKRQSQYTTVACMSIE